MNILHINTNDLRGGAAKVMMRLVESQKANGHISKVLVGNLESSLEEDIYTFDKKNNAIDSKQKGFVDYEYSGVFDLIYNPLFQEADIINLHNIHGYYFNPFALSLLSHLKPIVWTLHDMQSVTGHCSYSYDCEKWKTGCGNCPNLNEYPGIRVDRTKENWYEKRTIYNNSKLFIIPVAKWIENIAKEGLLKNQQIHTILNGVDINIYKPLDKDLCCQKYNIPSNKIIIGAVANGGTFEQERKGGKYVQQVIDNLLKDGHEVLLVNVGGNQRGYENEYLYNVGYITSEEEMAEVYNTFDIYLFPSTADTCPLVISEAMACGVPIVTFETGGIPELVQHERTGFVAPQKNVDLLYEYTKKLVCDIEIRKNFTKNARQYCVQHFNHEHVALKYIDVYEKAIAEFNRQKHVKLIFEKEQVPEVIWNLPNFQNGEKTKKYSVVQKYNISEKNLVIISDKYDNSWSNYKVITKKDFEEYEIRNNEFFYIDREKSILNDIFLNKMLYKGISTDVLASTILLVRKNGKKFFKAASIFENNQDVSIVNTANEGAFYSANFMRKFKSNVIEGESLPYNTKEEFSTELVKVRIEDYISSKVNREIYIYGAGTHTIELLKECPFLGELVMGILDKNEKLYGKKLLGKFEVMPLTKININTPILISSSTYENEIYKELKEKVTNELITIYNN